MDDAFGTSGGLRHKRKLKKGKPGEEIPASLGVRLGYVADVERPPPEGVRSTRRTKRIPTSVQIRIDGKWHRVAADISAGGALILYGQPIEGRQVEISLELADRSARWDVTGTILRREKRGRRYAHHIRFDVAAQVAGLNLAIQEALMAGKKRLETT